MMRVALSLLMLLFLALAFFFGAMVAAHNLTSEEARLIATLAPLEAGEMAVAGWAGLVLPTLAALVVIAALRRRPRWSLPFAAITVLAVVSFVFATPGAIQGGLRGHVLILGLAVAAAALSAHGAARLRATCLPSRPR